ncbi:MAG: radical SAM protein [Elusimicrobia bacterium]|nr:radical SAM protein [Elusimicrobiota bacterium]
MALHLRVTGACALDCVFCSYPDRSLRFDLAALARRVRASGERLVQVSGGEPLAAPRAGLTALLTLLRRSGKLVELQTSGVLAAELPAAYLARLAGLVDCFNVNCPAPDPATDLAVTRTPGAFARREAGIRALCASRRPVRLTFVACAQNLAALPRFPGYVARRFPRVGWLQVSFVKAQGRAAGRPDVVPTHARAARGIVRALRAARALGLRAEVDHIPVCHLPGFVDSHVDTWKMRRGEAGAHLSDKVKAPRCASCSLAAVCPGPRGDYEAVHGR